MALSLLNKPSLPTSVTKLAKAADNYLAEVAETSLRKTEVRKKHATTRMVHWETQYETELALQQQAETDKLLKRISEAQKNRDISATDETIATTWLKERNIKSTAERLQASQEA